MHQPTSHSVKAILRKSSNEEDIRRIKVQDSIRYQELVEKLQQMFQIAKTNHISITYRDSESDLCNITNDDTLKESFVAKKGEILRLELTILDSIGTKKVDQEESIQQTLVANELGEKTDPESFCNSSEAIDAITDAFNRFVEAIRPIIENFEKNAEKIKAVVPNPKALLEQLKPIFESFLNNPSASMKIPFQDFLKDLDCWLSEIDLWMHQKPSQETESEPSNQPDAESFRRRFKEFCEKFMNEAKSLFQDFEDWFAEKFPEEAELEQIPESNDQPFTESIVRPFKDLYEKVMSEIESESTEAEGQEIQLFEQQMQELRKMGFLNDEENLLILTQTNGDVLSAVLVLLDSY